jgi:hypothetical protein
MTARMLVSGTKYLFGWQKANCSDEGAFEQRSHMTARMLVSGTKYLFGPWQKTNCSDEGAFERFLTHVRINTVKQLCINRIRTISP